MTELITGQDRRDNVKVTRDSLRCDAVYYHDSTDCRGEFSGARRTLQCRMKQQSAILWHFKFVPGLLRSSFAARSAFCCYHILEELQIAFGAWRWRIGGIVIAASDLSIALCRARRSCSVPYLA